MPQKAPQPQPEPRKDPSLKEKIETETNWRGSTIRQFREAQGISIEEVSEYTKISKNYLRAIEEEQYAKLPAAVYLRGFLRTISKKLGIPFERVATTYLARYKEACPEKA